MKNENHARVRDAGEKTDTRRIYTAFVRRWYRLNPHTGKMEHHMGRKTILRTGLTYEEAVMVCREYNEKNDPGRFSRKAEFTVL